MNLLRLIFLLVAAMFLSLLLQSQTNDSITIIPMATAKPDSGTQGTITTPVMKAAPIKQDNFWRRIVVGGNLGFQFGTVTGINISPEVKIRIVDQLYGGVGIIYQYYHYKDWYYDMKNNDYIDFSSNIWGGRVFARYYLAGFFDNWVGNFFVHAEYEYLCYTSAFVYDPNGDFLDPYYNTYSKGKEVIEINSIFLGGGYRQPISRRAFVDFLILFNLNDTPYSPYTNPVFRLGVGVGL
ncbi:MAG: hypothetical protein V1733_10290 [bacterium]